MNNSQKISPMVQLLFRQAFRNASNLPVTPRFQQLKNTQSKFLVEDGTPVHYKNGLFDKFLTRGTMCLGIVGASLGLHTFYTLLFGKKS